jgi:hypothetical protein
MEKNGENSQSEPPEATRTMDKTGKAEDRASRQKAEITVYRVRGDLIYYRDKISLAPILRYLETQFEDVKSKEIKLLEGLSIRFTEPVVAFREFADRIGVSAEAARAFLAVSPPSGYVALADILVSNEKLLQIGDRINVASRQSGKMPLKEAAKIIEEEGIDDSANVLTMLGYRIRWRGINSEQAEVAKEPKKSGK